MEADVPTSGRRHSVKPLRLILGLLGAALLLLWTGLAAGQASRFEHGLLWRVSKPGVTSSHIFGTVHLPDPRLQPLPAAVAEAFAGARVFVAETLQNEYVGMRFFEGGQFRDGTRLDHLLDIEAFVRLVQRLEKRGWKAETVSRLKPWMALLLLTAGPERKGLSSLDRQLYVEARARRLRLGELDSVEEQVALFDAVPLGTQLALLEFCLEYEEHLPVVAERTLRAYLDRDLKALSRANVELEIYREDLGTHHAILTKKVIDDRNVAMTFRMRSYLGAGAAFIAIGAFHLYGERGVLSLLEKEGWQVERVH